MAAMDKIQIDKLEGAHNWAYWKFQVGILLKSHGVQDIITGDWTVPVNPGANAAVAELEKFQKALKLYNKADSQAMLDMTVSMKPEVGQLVSVCTTAKEMWDKLHSVYEQSSGQRRDLLYSQLFMYKMDPADSIVVHISKLQRLFNELQVEVVKVGCKLPEDLLLHRIIGTLPREYFEFRNSWESTADVDKTVKILTERLCGLEIRIQLEQGDDAGNSVALINKASNGQQVKGQQVKGQSKPVKRKTFNKSKVTCFNCNQKGHFQRECKVAKAKSTTVTEDESPGKAFVVGQSINKEAWVADSGSTNHVTNCKLDFSSYEKFSHTKYVRVGSSELLAAHGSGTVIVEMLIKGKWKRNHLVNVWYVPDMARKLLSVSLTTEKGFQFSADKKGCHISLSGANCIEGKLTEDKLYELNMRTVTPKVPVEVHLTAKFDSLQLWHERLGHQNKKHVRQFLKQQGISVDLDEDQFCEGCVFGKQHRKHYGSRKERASKPGELIHTDVCGPMQVRSIGGMKYFVDFKDDYSKYRKVYCIKEKSEVTEKFQEFINEAKVAGHVIKEVLSDGGKEFDNAGFHKVCAENGISHRKSMPYTPEQNGCAERENRTLVESARSMIHTKGLPIELWGEAVNTAAYVLNRSGPTQFEGKSPHELWFGKQATTAHLKVFGTECYKHIPKQKRQKWDVKSEKGILVGYSLNDGYRVWISSKKSVELSGDVVFKEEQVISSKAEFPIEHGEEIVQLDVEDGNSQQKYQLRDRTTLKKPDRYDASAMLVDGNFPMSYEEAISSDDSACWQQAMDDEMESLAENQTWELVDLPAGRKVIDNRWVLRVKVKPDGSIDKHKARLVAKGYSQKPGIDYDETFSPVARYDTIRTVLSVAACEGMKLAQFDVKTAFLYGELDEEIYMKQPEGYSDGSNKVWRLLKSLYGLKQAPRCWNKRFVQVMDDHQLQASSADPCLFVSKNNELIVALYVDDGLVVGKDEANINQFLKKLKEAFKITIGSMDCFLGMQIEQLKDGGIFINQEAYARKVLERFQMLDANKVATPIERQGHIVEEADRDIKGHVPYREAVGSLMYLAVATRPDIAYAVSIVSQKLENPKESDWNNVKRIFKYIVGTLKMGILYQRDFKSGVLEAFSDADYAGDVETRRSTSGVVCKYAGGIISWLSKKQASVSMSTTESEFIAASEGAKEVVWLTRLLGNLTEVKETPILKMDNASAIKLAKNPEFHKRSKHIEVRHYFVREKWQDGAINIEHVEGENQVADIMTKALVKDRFQKLRMMMGLVDGLEMNI